MKFTDILFAGRCSPRVISLLILVLGVRA